jgi:predicted GNAT family N-acyltransferase
VFVEEQGVPEAEEVDGRDPDAMHLVALTEAGLVGTCRLLTEEDAVRLGRLAVAPEVRRRGVASAILEAAEDEARRRGARRVVLNAQTQADELYRRHGYVVSGDRFLEAGIEHLPMERDLA